MPAYTDTDTTSRFADMLYGAADDADRDWTIRDGSDGGFMVPTGQTLLIEDHQTGDAYLITVRKATNY
jgi:hypothetical protein